MAATKNATSVFSNALTGNVVSASVARGTGEGLLCAVWQETDFASVGSASAPVWDAAGDNQAFTLLATQREWGTVPRQLSLFALPAPTTAKTGAVESTLTGGYGGANTHDRASMLVVRISGHDAADMIRASNATQIPLPATNDLPNTVASAVGDLVVYVGSCRENVSELSAGDTSGYEEFSTAISSRTLFIGTKTGAASNTTGTFIYINATDQSNALIAVSIKAGAAPAPVLTSPTSGTPGTTTITIGATSDSPSDGIMRFLRRVGGSAASAAIIASTGESQAATANPQSRGMTGFTAGSTNNFVDMVQVGAGGNSNVVSVGPFTMAAAGPTINTQPTAQTVSEGAAATYTVSATSSGGALSYQWQRQAPGGGAFSNVGTNSASYTTAATVCATDHGAQLRVQVTDSNGTTQSATVGLTVNATASTSRPGSDVTVAGWTASTGSDLFAMIDETSPADGDYITSPGLTSGTAPATFALAFPLAAGNRVVGVRARTDTGAATLRVYLLNDAGTVMGTTADQAINSTFATYSLAVTLSGAATRARVEVVV